MNPGILRIKMAEYIADPAPEPSLSAGIANILVTRSSTHAWHAHPRLNPDYRPENSSIMDAGSVAHSVLLAGDEREIVVIAADDWRTKVAKEQRDLAWSTGAIPVLERKMDAIRRMCEIARAYLAQSEVAGIFERSEAELTFLWEENGTWFRSRPDITSHDRTIFLDYKSTAASAEPFSWSRQITMMGYDMQAALALRGLRALDPKPGRETHFIFLTQENEPPYACSLIGVPPSMLDLAERRLDFAITIWKNCMAKKQWLGYSNRICWAEPQPWQEAQFEERQSLEEQLEIAGQA